MTKEERLYRIRHSLAHVMAEAVLDMIPEAKTAIGPPIRNGFYYDFDLPRPLVEEDLRLIEERMRKILAGTHAFVCEKLSRDEAKKLFADQPYKLELIDDLPDAAVITTYTVDTFVDLCKGPHVDNTEQIHPKAFSLLTLAGAYWRGKETNPMLQRIYATAWENEKELRVHVRHLEEVRTYDHRKLGAELDLFSVHEESGSGLIYWHPHGGRIRLEIEDYWRERHRHSGYEILYTPHIGKSWLWETSGHLDFYQENMYAPMRIDNADYYVKPMNCPFHIMIYKNRARSYQELPLRWAEMGTVYRYERSGVLHGLLRVRGFTQDDAHIFCTREQIQAEILEVLRFSLSVWKDFGFHDVKAYVATKPEKSVGDPALWEEAIESLKAAVQEENLPHEMDIGGGAFYGPKIDLKITDALGREWQMTTIQFDFNLPERFSLSYVGPDGNLHRPYMVHRALLGSLERFFGILIEHYHGKFPLWLSPVQVAIIPVAEVFNKQAETLARLLQEHNLRVDAMLGKDRMNAKIRDARLRRIPYQVILGEKEVNSHTVSFRNRDNQVVGDVDMKDFISLLQKEIKERK